MIKSTKWHVCTAKTQISLSIRPVWSVFAVRIKKAWIFSYPLSTQQRLWSDWADAQADLNLHWMHSHFVGFVMRRLISFCTLHCNSLFFESHDSFCIWSFYLNRTLQYNYIDKYHRIFAIFHRTGAIINCQLSPVKRICVFQQSVMTNFNCACPAIKKGQGSGFLSEGSSWLTACMSEQRRFWRDCADAQARLNLRCSHRL